MRPKVIDVKPIEDYNLIVTFDNGEVKLYDVKPLIKGSWFGQLKNMELFNTVHVAGISIEWAGGQDVCPDDLYYSSIPIESRW
jgi:hypothetical protein